MSLFQKLVDLLLPLGELETHFKVWKDYIRQRPRRYHIIKLHPLIRTINSMYERAYQQKSRELILNIREDVKKMSCLTKRKEFEFTSTDLLPLENYFKQKMTAVAPNLVQYDRKTGKADIEIDQVVNDLSPDIKFKMNRGSTNSFAQMVPGDNTSEIASFHESYLCAFKLSFANLRATELCYPLLSFYYPYLVDCVQVLPNFFTDLNAIHYSLGSLASIYQFREEINLRIIISGLKLGNQLANKKSFFFIQDQSDFTLQNQAGQSNSRFESPFEGKSKEEIILTINRELSKDSKGIEVLNCSQFDNYRRLKRLMTKDRLAIAPQDGNSNLSEMESDEEE